MTAETKPRRKKWKIAVGILLAVLILLAGGFFWYMSDYYRAEDVALEVLAGGEHLEVRDSLCFRTPGKPGDSGHGSSVENVLQSGGKVFGSGAGATCAAGRLNMKKSEQPS